MRPDERTPAAEFLTIPAVENGVMVSPPNVGVADVWISCGRESVIDPVDPDTVTWFVVPVKDVTPVLVSVIAPDAFPTDSPVEPVSVAKVYPVPFPISSDPFDAADPSSPVPP